MKMIRARTRRDPYLVFPATAAIFLGLIGFVPGLAILGPFGQGSTWQMGFLLGCGAGLAAAIRGFGTRRFAVGLLVTGAVWAAVLLVWRRSYVAGM